MPQVTDKSKKPNPLACRVYRKCGGCQLLHLDYPQQLAHKQEQVRKLLGSFQRVSPIIGMEHPYHYRNKVHAAFSLDTKGRIIHGPYEASTHRIVPVDSCLCEDEIADQVICTIAKLLKEFRLGVYDENLHRGFLRHVLMRRGFFTNELMVILVTGSYEFPRKRDFVEALLQAHPMITTVVQNINNKRTSMILGEKEVVLYGPGFITDQLSGKKFRISPSSFYQINPVQTVKLYEAAIRMAELQPTDTVLDAYCGIGTIGLFLSDSVEKVIGVELNKDAVRDAITNAKLNGIENCQFIAQDAGKYLASIKKQKLDVVMMDPPRTGSDETFLSALCGASPKKIVYVSCNPVTQKRDLLYLLAHGYRVKEIQPVDMFPFTEHVETVVLMSRKDK